VRHHAKFLNPVNLKDGWSMVTSTLAGMLLNWSAPLLVIVLAAFFVVILKEKTPASFWPTMLKVTGGLTLLALVAYCGLLRLAKTWSARGGWFLGISTALTFIAAACWLAGKGYTIFYNCVGGEGGWKSPIAVGLVGALI